jgi:hypothetical protein
VYDLSQAGQKCTQLVTCQQLAKKWVRFAIFTYHGILDAVLMRHHVG